LEASNGSMGKRVVEALMKLWREKGHLGLFTSWLHGPVILLSGPLFGNFDWFIHL